MNIYISLGWDVHQIIYNPMLYSILMHIAGKELERARMREGFVKQMVESAAETFDFNKFLDKAMGSVKVVMEDMYKDLVSAEANKVNICYVCYQLCTSRIRKFTYWEYAFLHAFL